MGWGILGDAYHAGGKVLNFDKNLVEHPLNALHSATNAIGLTNPPPPDLSKGPDADALRKFSGQLVNEYTNRQPGTAQMVAPTKVDTSQSDQARGIQQNTIGGLQGVASGATPTAADALLTKGTDAAARGAMGTAASYSAANPGEALRAGLAAGTDAYGRAASDAGILKANEQAAARGQLVDAANSMRAGDTGIATTNANAANAAATSNQTAGLTQEQLDNQNAQNMRSSAASGLLGPLAAAQAAQQIQMQNQAANSTAIGGLIGTGGTLLAHSDERLKTDIRGGSPDADAFLSSLTPRTYEMKDPTDVNGGGPGRQMGVVAQEMRPGDVQTGPDGAKWISADVIGKVLAGMGRLHERLASVEGGKPGADPKWGPNPYPAPEPPRGPITMPERRGG